MAVADKTASQLRLTLYVGVDEFTGEPKYKYKTISNVKSSATTDQLFNTAMALGSLFSASLQDIERTDRFVLSE